jgi:vesicle transport through interaction with t-SNAREs 1
MSADILRNYEQQFGIICADITSKISKSINGGCEQDVSTITAIEALFQDAREIIEQMELEIRDANSTQKRTTEQKEKYMNIIGGYKNELSKLESEFNRQLKTKSGTATMSTGLSTGNSFEIQLNEPRSAEDHELSEMKQQNKETLLKMNKNLENGYKMVLESEETGKGILSDLFGQRETLKRARDRLRETNTNLGKSSRVVTAMSRRIMQNKILLFALCGFLILVVVFVFYLAIRKAFS